MTFYDWSRAKFKSAKLKMHEVKEIREKHKLGTWTVDKLATDYKVSASAIRKLLNHDSWQNVK